MPALIAHDDLGDAALQAEWADLLPRDPHASVFQHPRYLRAWQATLGGDEEVSTLALRDDGLVGVVVEAVAQVGDARVVRLGGGTEVTDYRGPVGEPDAAKDLATAVAERLAAAPVDRIELSGLPDDSGWPDLLATALEGAGASAVTRERHDVAPVVDLSAGLEDWEESLPSKDRQELRRKARRLARELGPVELVEVDGTGLEAALERFFAMIDAAADHIDATAHDIDAAADDKASFFDRPEMRAWFTALADEFHGDGIFRLHELAVAGQPVAATVSLVWGNRWGLYNSAFHPRLAAFSPGIVLVAELVEVAVAAGVTTFDLLRGDEAYKYRFGAVDRDVVRVTAVPAAATA